MRPWKNSFQILLQPIRRLPSVAPSETASFVAASSPLT
jgi:hypothetical protein